MKQTLTAFFLLTVLAGPAQTLFSYGTHVVGKDEFLRAFNKNNAGNKNNEKAYRDYLALYIRFKLKVQAAYDARLDTLATQKEELQNFRSQIAEGFMNDESSIQLLVEEAFHRSQKDIRLFHIYLPYNGTDTLVAYNKVMEAYSKLKRGTPFEEVAAAYSQVPGVHQNKGELGWMTAFTLPYDLENLAYSTGVGKFLQPYRSRTAYHIFKISAERPAAGRMRAAQILLAFPPGADTVQKANIKNLADSIYQALKKGASFKDLVAKYSNDNVTYQSGGILQEFGVGKYNEEFENAVFSLPKDGDFSLPVLTSYGYHIIQRIEKIPAPKDNKNLHELSQIKQKVQADNRIQVSKQVLAKKIMRMAGYKKLPYSEALLWIYSDSAWSGKTLPQFPLLHHKTILFSFPKQKVTAGDFAKYLKSIKSAPELVQGKSIPQLLQQYIETVAREYYREHMEEFNKEFAFQMKEFKDGNLLFEIMQRQIWDMAASDSMGLKNYYLKNRSKYWWATSADVILFTCSDSLSAAKAKTSFEENKNEWRKVLQNTDGTVQADSGRYELTQLPLTPGTSYIPGYISQPVKTATDNVHTFVYIVHVYNQKTPRDFVDAKGFVINDYQSYLEDEWIESLKKKYPIKINEPILLSSSK